MISFPVDLVDISLLHTWRKEFGKEVIPLSGSSSKLEFVDVLDEVV